MKKKLQKIDIIIIAVLIFVVAASVLSSIITNRKVTKNSISKRIEKLEDYQYAKIGVLIGSNFEVLAKSKFPNAEFVYENSVTDLAHDLSIGKIDGFFMDETLINDLKKEYLRIGYVNQSVGDASYGAMFPKTEKGDKLRAEYNRFLKKIKSDGTYEELENIWIKGNDESKKTVDISQLSGENGTLRFVVNTSLSPFVYIKDNAVVGYDIDLVARFCQEYGYKLEITDSEIEAIIPAIKSEKYDMASACFTITEERKESVSFSHPTYKTKIYLAIYNASNSQLAIDGAYYTAKRNLVDNFSHSINKNFVLEDRWRLIAKGVCTTMLITILSVIFGTILAFLICLFRRTKSRLANVICDIYVNVLQGMPLVVFLMILYYIVFVKSGLGAIPVAIIGFTINFGATVSEIMNSGINSIDGGQLEAALALGYSEGQAFYKFVFPQAVMRFSSIYISQIVELLKGTAVVGYIAIQDLTKMGDIIRNLTYEAFFPLIATAVIYFALSWIFILLLKQIEKRFDPKRKRKAMGEMK